MLFFSCIFSLPAAAQQVMELYDYNQSVADLGRGGVHSIDPSVGSSMLANPAVLAFVKGFHWTILDLQAGTNGLSTYNLINQHPINQANLSYYYGQNVWTGLSGNTSMMLPNFGVAGYGNSYLDFSVSNPAYPNLNVEGLLDYGLVVGGAISLTPNLGFGANIKRITRTGGITAMGPGAITGLNAAAIQSAISSSGTGYGVDLGLLYRSDGALNSSWSLDWKDAGYTSFVPSTTYAPPPIADNLTLGYTMGQNAFGVGWMAGVELRHILNWDVDMTKKLYLGAELDLLLVDLRAGLYEGYGTLGASVDVGMIVVDAASYSVERGYYAGQQQDQRVEVGVHFEASVDANFAAFQYGGKKRQLKQRR